MKRGYSLATHKLLKRIEKVNLRQEYVFDKPEIKKLIKEVYEYLELDVPSIVWCKDTGDERFLRTTWATGATWAARTAGTAWAAGAARAAWAAGAARAAWATWTAGTAGAAGATWAAWATGAARATGAAGAAGITWTTRTAWTDGTDYDFDYLIFEYEYLQGHKGNKDDKKALKAYMYFLELKEAGLGYFAEEDGILYCCPNPILAIDKENRFHSEEKPAVYWKDGLETYFLHGVLLEKDLWKKILDNKLSFKECMALENIEQRMIALKYLGTEKLLKEAKAKLVDDPIRGYRLYKINNIFPRTEYLLKYKDPSTDREYVSFVPPDVGEKKDVIEAVAWKWGKKKSDFIFKGGES
jgi:hypothetical protein